jgi:hypothetical protein
MATPKVKTAILVRTECKMERFDVELDDKWEVQRDDCHYYLPSIELLCCQDFRAREKSHGSCLEVMAGSHS